MYCRSSTIFSFLEPDYITNSQLFFSVKFIRLLCNRNVNMTHISDIYTENETLLKLYIEILIFEYEWGWLLFIVAANPMNFNGIDMGGREVGCINSIRNRISFSLRSAEHRKFDEASATNPASMSEIELNFCAVWTVRTNHCPKVSLYTASPKNWILALCHRPYIMRLNGNLIISIRLGNTLFFNLLPLQLK
jgi:hypothetical protein